MTKEICGGSARAGGAERTAPVDASRTVDHRGYQTPAEVLGVQAPVAFLWRWLQTGESAYEDLYRGICLSELSRSVGETTLDWHLHTTFILDAVNRHHRLSPRQRMKLACLLDGIHTALPTQRRGLKEIRVLFLGDCLFEEVALFLAAASIRDGLLLKAEHIVSKNPLEQRRQLQSFESKKFFAVFYSPFSYRFNQDFARVLRLSHAMIGDSQVSEIVGHAANTVGRTIDMLADTLDCPIFVSNASTIQRGTTLLRRVVKSTLTSYTRRRAREQVNAWLVDHLAKRNQDSDRQLFLLDEAALAPTNAVQGRLGAYLHTSNDLHPTRFSRCLAESIAEHVQAVALCTRKLVVCDLDRTLWDGMVAEGHGVVHHVDRQATLQRLKEKSVMLALVSKNDPEKADWSRCGVDATSFVAADVSEDPKVQGIQRIYHDLNIKPKDGVFIHGRPDERALVTERWPEMHVADECDARTWRIFSVWADLLDAEPEFDRTTMYQRREKRAANVSANPTVEETAEMFARLELRATLKSADRGGVKRVSELINRTNQWNLAGSRTTVHEVEQWRASPDHTILTVRVDDKYGSMGTVCVAVLREQADAFEIPVFVLSCRVFGFGVETLMLEHVKSLARSRFGAPRVRGFFRATNYNAPCKEMYREHGHVEESDAWVYSGAPGEKTPPAWITVNGSLA